ncbi:MAG: cofactor-independent phosphoglycerate mutase [Victivallaceae bacterium]|nr:cofactor-independent phosphoglycerate mutase [Victivallaceae bacterium]
MAKAVVFLADGMADLPLASLGGRTPLEVVDTPAMDSIAAKGQNGTFLTLPDGLPTSSDVANMSVLGFYPKKNYPGRGPIEAVSQNIDLGPDDVAWRCNLVKVSPDGTLLDYSAGHIDNAVSSEIMKLLEKEFGSDAVSFYPGVSYRNLMVLHGKKFSNHVFYEKPDSSQGEKVENLLWKPTDGSPEAVYTVNFILDLFKRTADYLKHCPVKSEATHIWPWSPGYLPKMAKFSERYAGKTGAIISAVDVIRGIGKCAGMDVYEVPGATGFIDTNYEGKVAAALEALKTHDLVYLHVEAIDECSHMGDLRLKMQAIELFDRRIVAPVLKALEGEDVNFAVLPDHPVPIELRKHTTTPVPVAVAGRRFSPDDVAKFSERLAPTGTLGHLSGDRLIRKLLEI